MEVHHHPHVEKKSFKEYLSEGLMIFLAVFLGFIAENVREHIADHTKETEYVKSLVRDLKQDSVRLNEAIKISKKLTIGQDSLIDLLSDSSTVPNFDERAYHLFFKYATSIPMFNSTDRAITQLTSSGNFRLIGDQTIADSISNYYDKTKDAEFQSSLNNQSSDDCFRYAQGVFQLRYGLKPQILHKKLLTHDPAVISVYVNKLTQMRISQQYYAVADLQDIAASCSNLIRYLEKQYKL